MGTIAFEAARGAAGGAAGVDIGAAAVTAVSADDLVALGCDAEAIALAAVFAATALAAGMLVLSACESRSRVFSRFFRDLCFLDRFE